MSRIFGSVAVIVSACSFFYGMQQTPGTPLHLSLMVWGTVFLVLGILLLLVRRIF